MELSELQKEILYNAWALSLAGSGQVLEDWAVPEAHVLAEAGWLERRIEDDQLTWWWTGRASTALELDALVRTKARTE